MQEVVRPALRYLYLSSRGGRQADAAISAPAPASIQAGDQPRGSWRFPSSPLNRASIPAGLRGWETSSLQEGVSLLDVVEGPRCWSRYLWFSP